MTVSELRALVDNLDEYIHIPGGIVRLKKMVLHLAVSGQLVPQDPTEGTGEELYRQIQAEKTKLVKQDEMRKGKTLPEISEDEIPFEVPRSWRWTRVSDLGYSLGQKVPDQDFYYVDVASIDNESQRLKQPSVLAAKDAPSRARKLVKKGTVIYSTVRPYLLNTTIIEDELDKELIASTAFAILHPFVGVDSRWLLFNLTSNYFTDYTNRKSVGMAYPAINDAQFSMAVMPLPPHAEQRRIVTKIEGIFTLIDQLAEAYKSEQAERSKLVASSLAQLAKAENGVEDSLALTHLSEIIRTKADAKILRQTILHLAVSGQLVPQDTSEGIGEDLYKQIQAEKAELTRQGKIKKQKTLPEISEDEVPFAIPSSWKWTRLGESYDVRDGTHDTPKYIPTGYPLITSKNLSTGKLDFSNVKYISQSDYMAINERSDVKRNDILFAMIGSIGNPVAVDTDTEFSIKNVALFKPYNKKAYSKDWLLSYLFIASEDMKSRSLGAVQSFVSLGFLRNYPIPLPPLAEQKRIVTKTAQLLDLVSELEKHLEK